MKILLIQIEKTTDAYIADGVKIYADRLKNYVSFFTETITMPKAIRQKPVEEQKRAEALEDLARAPKLNAPTNERDDIDT